MFIFVCAVAVKVFGWWAILVCLGILGIGWIINLLAKDKTIVP
jgi:hypothetical protein